MGWRKTTDLFQQLLINKSGHTCRRQSSTSSFTLLAQLWRYRNIWKAHAGSMGEQELFNCRSLSCCCAIHRRQQIPSQRGCVHPTRSAGELWNWTQTLFLLFTIRAKSSICSFSPMVCSQTIQWRSAEQPGQLVWTALLYFVVFRRFLIIVSYRKTASVFIVCGHKQTGCIFPSTISETLPGQPDPAILWSLHASYFMAQLAWHAVTECKHTRAKWKLYTITLAHCWIPCCDCFPLSEHVPYTVYMFVCVCVLRCIRAYPFNSHANVEQTISLLQSQFV